MFKRRLSTDGPNPPGSKRTFVGLMTSLQQVAGWWPKEQHVLQARGPGEHDVEVEPPLLISGANLLAARLDARAVDGDAGSQCLPLRRRVGEDALVCQRVARALHRVCFRASP